MARSPPPGPARHSCRSRPREDTQTPASVKPKRRRPPRLSGGDLRGLKAEKAPSPLAIPKRRRSPPPRRRGSPLSQSERGTVASAAGASVIPKRKGPPRLIGGGLNGPKAKEAPSPPRRGPEWTLSEGGPLASSEGASESKKRRRPPRLSGGGLGEPKAKGPQQPQQRGPRWS